MLYTLVKFFSSICCVLPAGVRRYAGNLLGELCWTLIPKKRKKMAVNNIKISLKVDQDKAEEIARKSATRFGRMFAEVLCMPKTNRNNIGQFVRIEGAENLSEALSYGQGAVLATAHSGNWEILGAALAMNGFPLVAVVQKQTNAAMDRFINEYRTMAGMHVTYKTGVREMVRMLGEGKIIGLLMDQDQHSKGAFVEFFGRLASTPQGAAVLARMKDAPIVPAFITENSDGTHTVIIHPIVKVNKTPDKERDVLETTAKITKIIEQHIRKYPHEWFWLHNRWKTSPPREWKAESNE